MAGSDSAVVGSFRLLCVNSQCRVYTYKSATKVGRCPACYGSGQEKPRGK